MQIVNVQQCKSVIDGPVAVEVPSHSNSLRMYEVLITDPNDFRSAVCECKGFQYRGHCSHQREAVEMQCGWTEILGPEVQLKFQIEEMICPRCWGPTEWVLEYVDE